MSTNNPQAFAIPAMPANATLRAALVTVQSAVSATSQPALSLDFNALVSKIDDAVARGVIAPE
jgi:hypothetical protein